MRITDRQGRLLYELLPDGSGRQQNLPLDQIPLALRQATIATEDASFYQNPGVDPAGILRAVWINLRGGETLAGGQHPYPAGGADAAVERRGARPALAAA